jgi:hypothetical protein
MKWALAAVAVVSLVGCAHEYGATGFADRSSQQVGLRSGASSGAQAALNLRGLYGPNMSILRGAAFYRGTMFDSVVDLSWKEDEVTGLVNSAPTTLRWEPLGDGLHITGLYGGQLSNLRVTHDGIQGNIGGCAYQLVSTGSDYRGYSTCLGGLSQQAVLKLPADLGARSEGEQVALLSLLLTGSVGRSRLDMARSAELPSPGVDYYWAPSSGR